MYFDYLSKYTHLENTLFPDKQNYHDFDSLWGIYKNGKKVQSFNQNNVAEICYDFFDLEKSFEDVEMSKAAYFGTFDIYESFFTEDLNGYDMVWADSDAIKIRCQNPNQYKYLEKINSIKYLPYKSYWEEQYEKQDDELDDLYRYW